MVGQQVVVRGTQAPGRLDAVALQERKTPQIANDIAIVGVEPELIKMERRGANRIEPHRAGLRLSKLHA